MKILLATIFWRYKTVVGSDKEAEVFGGLDHKYVGERGFFYEFKTYEEQYSYWDQRESFRDVLPFKGVNGIVAFVPY